MRHHGWRSERVAASSLRAAPNRAAQTMPPKIALQPNHSEYEGCLQSGSYIETKEGPMRSVLMSDKGSCDDHALKGLRCARSRNLQVVLKPSHCSRTPLLRPRNAPEGNPRQHHNRYIKCARLYSLSMSRAVCLHICPCIGFFVLSVPLCLPRSLDFSPIYGYSFPLSLHLLSLYTLSFSPLSLVICLASRLSLPTPLSHVLPVSLPLCPYLPCSHSLQVVFGTAPCMPRRGPSAGTALRFSDTDSARRTGRWEPRPRGCERTAESNPLTTTKRANDKKRTVRTIDVTAARIPPSVLLWTARQGKVKLHHPTNQRFPL